MANKSNNWEQLLAYANEDLLKRGYSLRITYDGCYYTCDILYHGIIKDGVKDKTYAENYREEELSVLITDAWHYVRTLVEDKKDNTTADLTDADLTEGTAYELVKKLRDAVLAVDDPAIPVFVEDEEGRLENITHIWYDHTREMIRMTIGGVEFNDSEE